MASIVDLPNEILLIIFKKLHQFDVLYSLVSVNKKLDNVTCDLYFTRFVNLMKLSSNEMKRNPKLSAILERFSMHILPWIRDKMECLTIEACFLPHVIRTNNFPTLHQLNLINFKLNMAPDIFFKESSFIHMFKHQLTHLAVNMIDENVKESTWKLLIDIYNCIFDLLVNLQYLNLDINHNYLFQQSLLTNFCSTRFSSSSLVYLRIKPNNFDDCRHLLDGRFSQLHTFIVNLDHIYQPVTIQESLRNLRRNSSRIPINTNALCKLKCFSLYVFLSTTEFDNQIVPFVGHMSNLEQLTLSLSVHGRGSFVDGTYLNTHIFSRMPHLQTCTLDIITNFLSHNAHLESSADDIRHSFIQRGHHVDCYIDWHGMGLRRCHVYSIPLNMEYMRPITHGFLGGMFTYVRILDMIDDSHSFEHNFFANIARSFPLLNRLTIRNKIPQKQKPSHGLIECKEISSVVQYSHLVELVYGNVYIDYVEQFLSNTKTYLPYLSKLHIHYEHLAAVTENFTRTATRSNCAKVQQLTFDDTVPIPYPDNFYRHFPLL